MSNNIILIGFMGSGKSSVGRELSRILNSVFLDTDVLIESNLNLKIKDIFNEFGENYFREFEKHICKWLFCNTSNAIISTGGGAPMHWDASFYKNAGKIFYIDTPLQNIKLRLKGDSSRPLLNDLDSLYESRKSIYEKISHYKIDGLDSIENIAQKILKEGKIDVCIT